MDDVVGSFRPGLFTGKRVLVSGGSSGIGLAIAEGFARAGADAIATGSNETKLHAARASLSGLPIRFERLDVQDRVACAGFVQSLDRLDVLVNAAGIARPDDEFEEDVYLKVVDINLNSFMRFAMATRPLLAASHGSIINIASMLSYVAERAVPAYGAAKAGVLGLTRQLAHAFGPEGIRVNAVSPGYHRTDMTKPLWSEPQAAAAIGARTALKRWGTVDDLVGISLFLASPAAAYITGTDIPVDAGYLSGPPF